MTDEITLNNPLTDEQWDAITDVDFDKTERIWFHTKHGKEVEFAKVIRCKDCKHYYRFDGRCYLWSINRRENGYCDRAER